MRRGKATSYDVAKLAGVSQSAVSRAFSPKGSVSKKMRARILRAADELSYAPNAVAQSLSLGRTKLVGLLITQYSQQNYPVALKSAVDVLAKTGDSVLLQIVDAADQGDEAVQRLLQFSVDAIVSTASITEKALEACRSHNVPLTLINRRLDMPGIDHVSSNNRAMMGKMAGALKNSGASRLLFLDGPERSWLNNERKQGLIEGCRAQGLPAPLIVSGQFTYEGGRKAILEIADSLNGIDAIVSANDPMALGAIDALRGDLDMSVPGDIQVIGYDDTPTAALQAYQLTSVRQPMDRMLEKAIALAYLRIDDPDQPDTDLVLNATLTSRKSALVRGI